MLKLKICCATIIKTKHNYISFTFCSNNILCWSVTAAKQVRLCKAKKKAPAFLSCADAMQWRRTQDSVQRRRACTNEPQTCQPYPQRQGRLRSRFDFASAKKKAPAFLSCADAMQWRRTQDSNLRMLLTSTVFKTAALNHSANPPCLIILY